MKQKTTLALVILVLSSLACSAASQLFGEEPAEPMPVTSDILFEDDFSDTSSDWSIFTDEEGTVEYFNEGLHIRVDVVEYYYWSELREVDLPGDVSIEVDATKIGGPDNNCFGIMCRFQDEDNFYLIEVSSDGFARIRLIQDNEFYELSGDQAIATSAMRFGNATNKLRADCIGDTITLYINREEVITVQDSALSYGNIGLYAGTNDEPGTDIIFDNLTVRQR